jgi:DNA-binding response OmpR family regulator
MASDVSARHLSVLVVDDNRHAADSLVEMLRLNGHNARVAYSGVQALVIVRGWRPDVANLDVDMDGVSGVELATRMRNEVARPKMLLPVTWVRANDEFVRVNAGAFDHRLQKPVDRDELLGLLEAHSNRRTLA